MKRNIGEPHIGIIPKNSVGKTQNVISLHLVYKIEKSEDNKKKMKARICTHGNRDKEKENIHQGGTNEQFDVIHMFLLFDKLLHFRIGVADVEGALLKSRDIFRTIYVNRRPPKDILMMSPALHSMLWNILRLPYGIN